MALKHRQNDKARLFGGPNHQLPWTEYLKCCICAKEFNKKGKLPTSLGCGHTYCQSCVLNLKTPFCQLDQIKISYDVSSLPINTALLQLLQTENSTKNNDESPIMPAQLNHQCDGLLRSSIQALEELALHLRPGKGVELSRPMQRKLIGVINNQLFEEQGRQRTLRCCKASAERTTTELILYHQSPTTLSSSLWDAVRARGCQFLGPAMQEEALKLIQFALEDQSELSRKVLVQLVVQKLQPQFPQASKTSIGHVVQLLYRASCFIVTKRDGDSSLMRLKDEFLSYDDLRKEHDAQIVQIAREAGLRISPDQWTALLYGDQMHKSYMQSIIDRLQSGMTFDDSIKDLIVVLERSGDPGSIKHVIQHLNRIARVDVVNTTSDIETLQTCLVSLNVLIKALLNVLQNHQNWLTQAKEATQQCSKYKTSMCRDSMTKGVCPRGEACTFAHSEEELQRYRNKRRRRGTNAFKNKVAGSMEDHHNTEVQRQSNAVPQQPQQNVSPLTYVSGSNGSYASTISVPPTLMGDHCHHCNCSNKVALEEKCSHYIQSQRPQQHTDFHKNFQFQDPSSSNSEQNSAILQPVSQQVFDKHFVQPTNTDIQSNSNKAFKPNQTLYNRNVQPVLQMPNQSSYVNSMHHNMSCCHVQPSHSMEAHSQPAAAYAVQRPITYMPLSSLSPPLAMTQQRPDMYLHQAPVPPSVPNGQYIGHNVYLQFAPQGNDHLPVARQQKQHQPKATATDYQPNDMLPSKSNKEETLDDLRRRKNEVINKLVQKQIVQPKHELVKAPNQNSDSAYSGFWPTTTTAHDSSHHDSQFAAFVDKEGVEASASWPTFSSCTSNSKNFQQPYVQEVEENGMESTSNTKSNESYKRSVMSQSVENGQYNLWAGSPCLPSFTGDSFHECANSSNMKKTCLVDVTAEMGGTQTTHVIAGSACKCCDCSNTTKCNATPNDPSGEDEVVSIQNLRIVSKYGPIARTVRSNTTPAIPNQVQANGNAFTQPIASHDKRSESNFSSLNKNTDAKLRVCTDVEPTSLEQHWHNSFSSSLRSNDELSSDKMKELQIRNEQEDLMLAMELQRIEINIQSKLKAQ